MIAVFPLTHYIQSEIYLGVYKFYHSLFPCYFYCSLPFCCKYGSTEHQITQKCTPKIPVAPDTDAETIHPIIYKRNYIENNCRKNVAYIIFFVDVMPT